MDNFSRTNVRGFQFLSARETQLIILASDGLTDKEIAQELGISLGTVITLWSRVRAKLSINSRISAVAVMSSVLARLSSTFSPFDGEAECMEGMLGKLSRVRLLVNSRNVILAASNLAAMTFSLKPGHSLTEHHESGLRFTSPDGQHIPVNQLPWTLALQKSEDVLDFELSTHGNKSQDYRVDCHAVTDPILNAVVVIDFKPVHADQANNLRLEYAAVQNEEAEAWAVPSYMR